jgi:hypothetical protein
MTDQATDKALSFAEFRELHSVSSKRLRAAVLGRVSTRVIRNIIQDILDKTLECNTLLNDLNAIQSDN